MSQSSTTVAQSHRLETVDTHVGHTLSFLLEKPAEGGLLTCTHLARPASAPPAVLHTCLTHPEHVIQGGQEAHTLAVIFSFGLSTTTPRTVICSGTKRIVWVHEGRRLGCQTQGQILLPRGGLKVEPGGQRVAR